MIFSELQRVLVVAAHPDDEVLGCGGTVAMLAPHCTVWTVICSNRRTNGLNLTKSAKYEELAKQAAGVLGVAQIGFLRIPDEEFYSHRWYLMKWIEEMAGQLQPELVLTHCFEDCNQDHRAVYEACLVAFRPWPNPYLRGVLHFEIPSGTRPDFAPNLFVSLNADNVAKKREALRVYAQEIRDAPHPRSLESIEALEKWRGSWVGVPHAEAFRINFMREG